MAYIPDYEGKNLTCMVLRIERSSIHDGEGFRTVVFLKGCPLRCQWCSTPESQSPQIEAAQTGDTNYGVSMTVEQILKEVRKDIPFYFHSGGGMTLSGGEIFSQPEAAKALLREARAEGIRTAIETSFFTTAHAVERVLPYVETAFVDLKLFDAERHKAYCGVDNGTILYNLLYTNQMDWNGRLIVRTPLIPGINDMPEELEAIGRFCAQLKKLQYVQLLPYHRLGTETYRKLGRTYQLPEVPTPSAEHMEKCRAIVRKWVADVR